MEQFMQIGGVVGGLKALMVFQDCIQINQRQCVLLVDMLTHAYKTIAQEMKKNLKFEERNTKWKVLENPLREILRVFKEAEVYIRQCMETKDWWAKAITIYQNTDCVEFHLHNLLCCFSIVIEAIEIAGELSGFDPEEFQKKRLVHSFKYKKDFKDPRIFQWTFGHQYLINQDFYNRLSSVWDEDRWILVNKLQERKIPSSTKQDQRLVDLLLKCLNRYDNKLLPYNFLVGSKDYQVRRRLGSGSQYKEIQWLGESFAIRQFFGDIEPLMPEISRELSHPNIMHIFCGFTDEEKKECILVMELMSKDLSSYIREISGTKKRLPFSLPVAVDLMLQIARGMEYLHANNMYHGDLKPSNILVKNRNISTDGYTYLHAKVCGFGPSFSVGLTNKSNSSPNGQQPPVIWYAPEVLAEQDLKSGNELSKYTEKADVYSFGMICFELLTGKVPFEDGHLQGDKMSRNIRAGERPLFPFHAPKYLTNLTKKCWHADPNQRPGFGSICRILRYVKRFLVMNPDHSNPEAPIPLVDYTDMETTVLKNFPWENSDMVSVSQIPYQMFVYRLAEKEKLNTSLRENSESGSDGASACGDEPAIVDDPWLSPVERKYSLPPEVTTKKVLTPKRSAENKANKQPGTPRGRSERPPQMTLSGRSMRMKSESQLLLMSPKTPRRRSGHVSDSEIS